MNNNTVTNPYTSKIPGGTLNKVQLTNPRAPGIQWPSISGNTQPTAKKQGSSFLRKLFG